MFRIFIFTGVDFRCGEDDRSYRRADRLLLLLCVVYHTQYYVLGCCGLLWLMWLMWPLIGFGMWPLIRFGDVFSSYYVRFSMLYLHTGPRSNHMNATFTFKHVVLLHTKSYIHFTRNYRHKARRRIFQIFTFECNSYIHLIRHWYMNPPIPT